MLIEPLRTHIKHSFFQFSLRPDEVHSSGWKLVYNYNQSSVPEKNHLITSRDSRMRNIHQAYIFVENNAIVPIENSMYVIYHYPMERSSNKIRRQKIPTNWHTRMWTELCQDAIFHGIIDTMGNDIQIPPQFHRWTNDHGRIVREW